MASKFWYCWKFIQIEAHDFMCDFIALPTLHIPWIAKQFPIHFWKLRLYFLCTRTALKKSSLLRSLQVLRNHLELKSTPMVMIVVKIAVVLSKTLVLRKLIVPRKLLMSRMTPCPLTEWISLRITPIPKIHVPTIGRRSVLRIDRRSIS